MMWNCRGLFVPEVFCTPKGSPLFSLNKVNFEAQKVQVYINFIGPTDAP